MPHNLQQQSTPGRVRKMKPSLCWKNSPPFGQVLLLPGITRSPIYAIPLAKNPRYQALVSRLEAQMRETKLQ